MTLLEKLFSKEAAKKAAELVTGLPKATSEAEEETNHANATDALYDFIESIDQDLVRPIPYAGPFLAMIVDTPPVNSAQREACAWLIEQTYRALKYGGKL